MATTIGKLSAILSLNTKPWQKGLRGAGRDIAGFTGSVNRSGAGLLRMARSMAIVGAAAVGLGGSVATAAKSIQLASDFEKFNVVLNAMAGDADIAKTSLMQLEALSITTPFEFTELQRGTKTLVGMGFAVQDVAATMRVLGDVAAGTGASVEELAFIFGQSRVEGKLLTRDIRQFATQGVPVLDELGKVLGVTKNEVFGLAEQGKIGFADLQKAFINMTSSGGRFDGMMSKLSDTVGGRFSNVIDIVSFTLRDLGLAFFDAFDVKGKLEGLAAFLQNVRQNIGGVTEWLRSRVGVIKNVVMDGVQGAINIVVPVLRQMANSFVAFGGFLAETVGSGIRVILGLLPPLTFLRDAYIRHLATIEFGFLNWKSIVEYASLGIMLSVVRLGNQIAHVMTVVIPTVLGFMARNWKKILVTLAANTLTLFENLFSNIVDLIVNLPDLISGAVNFSEIWKPLTDGFVNALDETLHIPTRQIGAFEQELMDELGRVGADIGDNFTKHMADRMSQIDQDTFGDFANLFKGDAFPDLELNLDPNAEEALKSYGKAKQSDFRQVSLTRIATRGVAGLSQKNDQPKEKQVDITNRLLTSIDSKVGVARAG